MILDATASYRSMWIDKKDPDAVFIDQRHSVKPDIVCRWQQLPFRDASFSCVNFDPPHMLYSVEGKPSFLAEKFGMLEPETWKADLSQAFNELMRVLEPGGVLLLKWNDNHISTKRLLACFPFAPKFGTPIGGSRGLRNKRSKQPRSTTSWFCFVKPEFGHLEHMRPSTGGD
jgi:ubiquinone/menaquinone biosynthesis C-methylase UbiE